jgi:hypothetical protein
MGRPSPFPTFEEAMKEELDELAWMASFVDSLFSGMLHIPELASLHQRLWMVSRILALSPCLLEPLCLCVRHRIRYVSP